MIDYDSIKKKHEKHGKEINPQDINNIINRNKEKYLASIKNYDKYLERKLRNSDPSVQRRLRKEFSRKNQSILKKKMKDIVLKDIDEYLKHSYSNDLYHYGVKGQKKGIRRWQYKDGRLTPEGKIHYNLNRSRSLSVKQPTLSSKTISSEAVYKKTGEHFKIVEYPKNITTYAGYGTNKPLKKSVINGLNREYGISSDKWSHRKGDGFVDNNGKIEAVDLHWFQEPSVGKVNYKIKEWKDRK